MTFNFYCTMTSLNVTKFTVLQKPQFRGDDINICGIRILARENGRDSYRYKENTPWGPKDLRIDSSEGINVENLPPFT